MAKPKPTSNPLTKLPRLHFKASTSLFAAVAIFLYGLTASFWRLSSLTYGHANLVETSTKHQLFIDSPWWKSPSYLYGPFYALLHATFALNRSLFSFRTASVIVGILIFMSLFWLINHWHGYRIAILATAAFISSFGYLAVARQGSPLIMQLLISIATLVAIVVIKEWDNFWTLILSAFILAITLYVPSGIWFAVAAIAIAFPEIKETLGKVSIKLKSLLGILFLILIAPLIYYLVSQFTNDLITKWLGYGLHGQLAALQQYWSNFYHVPLNLLVYANKLNDVLPIGHLPLIPVAESILILIGLYYYLTHLKNSIWRSVIILMITSWIVAGFGILSSMTLLPLLFLAMATGLTYMLKQWYGVFPRNPIARNSGFMVLTLVVLFCCFYSARSYFVTWRYDPATAGQYNARLR